SARAWARRRQLTRIVARASGVAAASVAYVRSTAGGVGSAIRLGSAAAYKRCRKQDEPSCPNEVTRSLTVIHCAVLGALQRVIGGAGCSLPGSCAHRSSHEISSKARRASHPPVDLGCPRATPLRVFWSFRAVDELRCKRET